jgi:hypothetical protein
MHKPHTPTQSSYLKAVLSCAESGKPTVWSFVSEEKATAFRNQVYKVLRPYRQSHLPPDRGFDPKTVATALGRVHFRVLCGENRTALVSCEEIPLSFGAQAQLLDDVPGDYNRVMSGENRHSGDISTNFPRPDTTASQIPSAYPRRNPPASVEEESEAAFLRKLLQSKEI